MKFNTYVFICGFLPLVLLGFRLLQGKPRLAAFWLTAASLVFYGWWNPAYLGLLTGSILINYVLGMMQGARRAQSGKGDRSILTVAVVLNLALLAWFKYAGFMASTVTALTGVPLALDTIILPLAISFFTFQQIAYQIDTYHGLADEHDLLDYSLFVTFFPQLIAGPIVHHRTVWPQFRGEEFRLKSSNMAIGMSLFFAGLFKKVVIADTLAVLASPVFAAAAAGDPVSVAAAWAGTIAFTLQIYFDFSGYSDMAIGLARMFGIKLPQNFDSPLQARSIIDFWNRWHMTLSHFLRDYCFFPLAGRKPGLLRRHSALFMTMVLGGLWHGAAWTFVVWGALHGIYLAINHTWRSFTKARGWGEPGFMVISVYWALTFLGFAISLVFFRAEDFASAMALLGSMVGLVGEGALGFPGKGWGQVLVALIIAIVLPNCYRIMASVRPTAERRHLPCWLVWKPSWYWLLATVIIACYTLTQLANVSEFLYYQF